MSRTPGALSKRTESFIRAVSHAPGDDLLEKFYHVSNDENLPLRLRLDAVRHLSGYLAGRVRLNAKTKAILNDNMEQTR
ncbi:hypothetical protein OAI11_00815 [Rhodospirillales bacterium]|nr:hypothetical protein [Rhodospirillales bacterium]